MESSPPARRAENSASRLPGILCCNALARGSVGLALACVFLLPIPTRGQEAIQEKAITARPLAPAREADYRPCSWTPQRRTAMCLKDRLDMIYDLQPAAFSGKGSRCQLAFEGERPSVRFRCGRILVAFERRIADWHFRRVAEAAEGEWGEFETHPDKVIGILRVTPGTERNALFRIILYQGILWADFHRYVQVITDADGALTEPTVAPVR